MTPIDINRARAIKLSAARATSMAALTADDERRIYRHALRAWSNGASTASVIGHVYSEATKCAKCGRGAA